MSARQQFEGTGKVIPKGSRAVALSNSLMAGEEWFLRGVMLTEIRDAAVHVQVRACLSHALP